MKGDHQRIPGNRLLIPNKLSGAFVCQKEQYSGEDHTHEDEHHEAVREEQPRVNLTDLLPDCLFRFLQFPVDLMKLREVLIVPGTPLLEHFLAS